MTDSLQDSAQSDSICPNCKSSLQGQFCSICGQNQKGFDRFFFSLLAEAFEDVFAVDSRAARTLMALIFRPGFLTVEYFLGRRARYVQPLRLYFITSIAFFTMISIQNSFDGQKINIDSDQAAQVDDAEVTQDDKITMADLELKFLSVEQRQYIVDRMNTQVEKAKQMVREDPQQIIATFMSLAPPTIFCLLPFFALLLKIFYLNIDRFYTEHLVLAVHNHCFIYLVLLLNNFSDLLPESIVSEIIGGAIVVWIPIYLLFSLKAAYQESWPTTFVKYLLLTFSYWILFLFAVSIATVIGLMSL